MEVIRPVTLPPDCPFDINGKLRSVSKATPVNNFSMNKKFRQRYCWVPGRVYVFGNFLEILSAPVYGHLLIQEYIIDIIFTLSDIILLVGNVSFVGFGIFLEKL